MKHSMEGKELRDDIYKQGYERKNLNADQEVKLAQIEIMKKRESGAQEDDADIADQQNDGDEEDQTNDVLQSVYKTHVMKKDYNELFKGQFMLEKDIVRGPSVAKLRGDDVNIMMDLIAKHKEDISSMVKDIKTNYMQWSKSEVTTKYKAYYAHNHLKTTTQ